MKINASTAEHERVLEYLRKLEAKSVTSRPTDAQIMTNAGIDSERRVLQLLADLADTGRIRVVRSGPTRMLTTRQTSEENANEFQREQMRLATERVLGSLKPDDVISVGKHLGILPSGVGFENVLPIGETILNPKTTGDLTQDSECCAKSRSARRPAESTGQKAQQPAAPQPKKPDASTTSNRRFSKPLGMPPSIENRHPDELKLDDSYQRSTDNGASQSLIKRIANGWDWRMCLPLVVSKRDDGSLWVLDGQHRLAAAKLRGDIPFMPCCVSVYGSVADEAAMFVAMNRSRKPMNRLDDFHAAIASGDSDAIEIARLITDAGFSVSRKTGSQSWRPGEVAFTSAIAKVLRKHGAIICADALGTMKRAWPDQVLNAGSSMFTALTKLALNPPEGFEPERMFRALQVRDQREWASFLNETKGGGDERAHALKQVLLMAYEEAPSHV